MLHGKGQQWWYTNDYESDRLKALEDRTRYNSETLEKLDINADDGGGRTDEDTYLVKTFPFRHSIILSLRTFLSGFFHAFLK